MTHVPLMTADELLRLQPDDARTELIAGRMIVCEPPSAMHGRYAAHLAYLMAQHVTAEQAGAVFVDSGFQIRSDPDTVLGPDVAFVSAARLDQIPPTGFATMAPDLVAEVMSPGDRMPAVLRKVADWLDAGVALVWVVDPRRRTAQLFHSDGAVDVVDDDGDCTGGDVLPGFRCPLRRVLDFT